MKPNLSLPRIALPASTAPVLQPVAEAPPSRPAPTMSDGSRVPMPPITVPADKPATDRRAIYVGAGLVVLAALFWRNRRHRDRLDHTGAARRDDDADDLHAAAKGDDADER